MPAMLCRFIVGVGVAVLIVLASGWRGQAQTIEIDVLRPRAVQGDAWAQYDLGHIFADGRGVPQDYEEALWWWRLAAEQGLAMAMTDIGLMYSLGRGVLQDDIQAYMWWDLAALRFPMATGEREAAVTGRDSVAQRLSPEQVAEAQRLASEWDAAHPR